MEHMPFMNMVIIYIVTYIREFIEYIGGKINEKRKR